MDILGAGPPERVLSLAQELRTHDPDGRIRLVGPVERRELSGRLNGYAGYVMPSRRETYGMAYVEALFAGLPLLYSKDRGVDGMVPQDIGYACDPNSPEDVAAGMISLIGDEAKYKAAVAAAQASGALNDLANEQIALNYKAVLDSLFSTPDASGPGL